MSTPQESRRNDLSDASGSQVVQTRQRLVDAFRAAAEQNLPSVSVLWLCTQSGVARSTFYTHFATVDELAVFTISQALAVASIDDVERRLAKTADRRTITRAGLEQLIDALEGSRVDVMYAIRIGSRAVVVERLSAEVARLTRQTVVTEAADLDAAAVDLATEYIGAGTVHAVLLWMEHKAVTREQLIDQLVDLLPAFLTS